MEKKQKRRRDGVWRDADSGIWRCRFMIRGRRYFQSLPESKNKTEAKAERDRLKTLARAGKLDARSSSSTNFKRFVEETFLPWVETNQAKGTYKNYKCRTQRLVEAFGSLELSEVSAFGVERFKRQELERVTNRGKGPTPGTVNSYLVVLAAIFTLAEELGKVEKSKRPKITLLKAENRRLRYLSVDEERRLLLAAAARPYLADLIVVALATGLRRDELFSLRAEDVDLNLNLVNVLNGKGGKARSVPLDPRGEACATLARLCRTRRGKYLFASPWAKDKASGCDESLAAAAKRAELDGVTLHTLRHTFGTRLAASGVDLRTVQELMGHADIQTTMIYAHVVEGNKHAAIARLGAYRENCHEIATEEDVGCRISDVRRRA